MLRTAPSPITTTRTMSRGTTERLAWSTRTVALPAPAGRSCGLRLRVPKARPPARARARRIRRAPCARMTGGTERLVTRRMRRYLYAVGAAIVVGGLCWLLLKSAVVGLLSAFLVLSGVLVFIGELVQHSRDRERQRHDTAIPTAALRRELHPQAAALKHARLMSPSAR